VEPGHHYEWSWLLTNYLAVRDRAGLAGQARALFATARAFGHHRATGAAADTMAADGTQISARARCWPQTEALKAAIVFEKAGVESAADLRRQMIDVLFDHYLAGPVPGGWIDVIDSEGAPVSTDMPASTFYHVFCALAEHLDAD